jgi:pantoate--beta-alanine ligase
VAKVAILNRNDAFILNYQPEPTRQMILFKRAIDLSKSLDLQLKKGNKISFVPTMGALHPGHISLIEAARKDNNLVVSSIFVNPTQFNNPTDFEKYPVTIEKDIAMLEGNGCDLLFLPSVDEIYPAGTEQKKEYELGFLETILEGRFRPGHYQGVCMVVHRLLEIVQPDILYLGQKDYQQCMVIKKLLGLTGLSRKIEIKICPTLREADGLAMSSRNMRLSEEERKRAVAIWQSLSFIKENQQSSSPGELKVQAVAKLEAADFKVDYVEIADANDLSPINEWKENQNPMAFIAAYLNDIRLIDNMPLN